jgi:D-arabinose 1-dehydrogenase-like Zn-dependent alcohol dehydrogenase
MVCHRQPLERVNEVFDRLRRGAVQGRVVLDLQTAAKVQRLAS